MMIQIVVMDMVTRMRLQNKLLPLLRQPKITIKVSCWYLTFCIDSIFWSVLNIFWSVKQIIIIKRSPNLYFLPILTDSSKICWWTHIWFIKKYDNDLILFLLFRTKKEIDQKGVKRKGGCRVWSFNGWIRYQ